MYTRPQTTDTAPDFLQFHLCMHKSNKYNNFFLFGGGSGGKVIAIMREKGATIVELKQILTRYINPSEASTIAFIRFDGVVGVVRSTFITSEKRVIKQHLRPKNLTNIFQRVESI